MKISTALEHFVTKSAIAAALGISKQAVAGWGDLVPEGSAYKIESITGGALKVDPAVYKRRKVKRKSA